MARHRRKSDLPVSEVRRYLEPGPIVLVTSAHGDKRNIMTMGWHTVMEFTPSLVGCVIASGNHSFGLTQRSKECVINLATTALTDQVIGVGSTSGAEVDKFEKFTRDMGIVCAPVQPPNCKFENSVRDFVPSFVNPCPAESLKSDGAD